MTELTTRRAVARHRKVMAVAAAGAVLLTGATVTSLAAWLDEGWVTAGVDGAPGVLAFESEFEFEIEQSVASEAGAWFDRKTVDVAGVIDFDDIAVALSPGDVAYGWVSLRTAADSLGGNVTLVSDYTLGDSPLGDALRYGARLHPDATTCTAAAFAGTGSALVPNGSELAEGSGATTFALAASAAGLPGTPQTVCFRVELPSGASNALMGETADVTWFFDAIST
ncbi:hypothetical protein [Pseudolysinimonas sp.]|uniref:hypothetical protein n=1 Tax=Pseudolysinimonas sp. TaxID=2680009 RepID=UPI00286C0095|nr:hypothetical protein [Pseudolysinimonas sp.]